MKSDSERSRRLLACVGNASRWRVVKALVGGERCVTELASRVRLSQSCTTRHLQALVREGVVRGTRDGKRVVFALRLDEPLVRELLSWALPEALVAATTSRPAGVGQMESAARPAQPAGEVESSPASREKAADWEAETGAEPEPQPDPRQNDIEDWLL